MSTNTTDNFLSQEEVDALLRGVTGEDETPAAAAPASEPKAAAPARKPKAEASAASVQPYSLGTQERIVRGRMPTLELINERFARLMRLGLLNYMQRAAEITTHPVKVVKYGEFMRNLVMPTNLNLVSVKPLRGTGLFVFDPSLVFLVVDNMFGGDGRFHMRVEGREFTVTEQRIIRSLLKVVFDEYQKAWQPVHPLQFEFIRAEMNSQFANVATPSEIVITSTFTVEIGNVTTEMHIVMPYSMIEPIRDLLYSAMQSDHLSSDRRWVQSMREQLHNAEVEVVASMGTTEVTLGDLLNMKVGDVIPLNVPSNIAAEIDGIAVMECRYGTHNGQYALLVDKFVGDIKSLAQGAAQRSQA